MQQSKKDTGWGTLARKAARKINDKRHQQYMSQAGRDIAEESRRRDKLRFRGTLNDRMITVDTDILPQEGDYATMTGMMNARMAVLGRAYDRGECLPHENRRTQLKRKAAVGTRYSRYHRRQRRWEQEMQDEILEALRSGVDVDW